MWFMLFLLSISMKKSDHDVKFRLIVNIYFRSNDYNCILSRRLVWFIFAPNPCTLPPPQLVRSAQVWFHIFTIRQWTTAWLSMDLFVYLCLSEFTQVPPSSVTSLCNVLLLSLLQGGHSFLPEKFQEFSRSFWQFSRSFPPSYNVQTEPWLKT